MEQPNLRYIDELAGNDKGFKKSIILILKKELDKEIQSYKTLMASQKYIATSELVHKLKHKISVLGLDKSYYIAESFESELKQSNCSLQPSFEEILAIMQKFVSDL
jgi:HPt (histidine-containing phosphotransfer) domain-containing protein